MADEKQLNEPSEGTESSTQERASTTGEPKRLYRSLSDRYIAGVCGGIAEYFSIDANLVRIVWAISAFMGGIGIVAYIAAWIIVPESTEVAPTREKSPAAASNAGLIIGVILIVIGLGLLVDQFHLRYVFPWGFNVFDGGVLISLLVIGLGVYLVLRRDQAAPQEPQAEQTAASGEVKKFTRSISDRKIAGVCGGLARYFNIDASIIRIAFVLMAVAAFFVTITAYIVMAIVVPEEENEEVFTKSGPTSS